MDFSRYKRQMRFAAIGENGQKQLANSHVLVAGVGALGSHLAEMLSRAGVGTLTLVDRDYVDETNLHRQALYNEEDARLAVPKAVAAAAKIAGINSHVKINPVVADIQRSNIEIFLTGVNLIVDGSDNFQLRYLLNDISIARSIPWVYGGVIGATGMSMAILPGVTPCLRCFMKDAPRPEAVPSIADAGVLPPTVQMVTAFQTMEALKILTTNVADITPGLFTFDMWTGEYNLVEMSGPSKNCPVCIEKRFDFM